MKTPWMFFTFFVTSSAFSCPREGLYPDLSDCSKYYICSSDGEAFSQSCPSGDVFDASSLLCSNTSNSYCKIERIGKEYEGIVFKDEVLQHQLMVEQQILRATQRPDYDTTSAPSSTNLNWMSEVPDSAPLSSLSLPGTHNTMSLYGGPWAECQTWSLFDQLRAGIRFTDVRTRHFNNALPIHHGIMFQKTGFETVLKEMVRFLNYQPSETILMRVREEYKSENNNQSFTNAINDYLFKFLPENRRWSEGYLPTMGQARGRVVVLRDFNDYRWVHFRSFSIDDKWDVKSIFHVGEKWDSVWQHLERAQNGNSHYGFITFMSGSSALAFPSAVATRINPRFWNIIKERTERSRWGIVAMDFPGVGLIKGIIKSNFY